MSPLHPAAATPTQASLFPAPTPAPDVDTSRIPTRLYHGRPGDAAARTCPRCGTWVITTALTTHADLDPHPLPTPQLELAALLLGRRTYTLHGGPPRFEVSLRAWPTPDCTATYCTDCPGFHATTIRPANTTTVLATHHCGTPPLTHNPIPLHPPPPPTSTAHPLLTGAPVNTQRPPRIVGIDPSLTSTGIAVVDTVRGITTHRVRSKGAKDATLAERARRLRHLADDVITITTAGITALVVIESPAYSNSLGSMHDRSGLWWLLVNELRSQGIPVLEVPPTTRAKYATGRGNAGKDEVLAAVIRRHPDVDVTGNDIADALTLAAIGARLTGYHLEATIPAACSTSLTKLRLPTANDGANVRDSVRARGVVSA
ncbi:crossover junction endodeoxyribonuclease RuvC [Litorihabitans aurantiacus]|uniref:Holliday junction nuclease RuvC n=1 Tax=Litorihabitans aurantiacus TaxID=1930061 RepID=A0AA38CR04_9MICO|nr:crossover junction endodeoxyribonuclease RuvC [Litorihabitans aurantiacus]GMA31586.1 hypothetical protein GCM10025875_15780 [Litorihabitans aurantiacus]